MDYFRFIKVLNSIRSDAILSLQVRELGDEARKMLTQLSERLGQKIDLAADIAEMHERWKTAEEALTIKYPGKWTAIPYDERKPVERMQLSVDNFHDTLHHTIYLGDIVEFRDVRDWVPGDDGKARDAFYVNGEFFPKGDPRPEVLEITDDELGDIQQLRDRLKAELDLHICARRVELNPASTPTMAI